MKPRIKYKIVHLGGDKYTFQVLQMDEQFRTSIRTCSNWHEAKNLWHVASENVTEIEISTLVIYLRGINKAYDNSVAEFTATPSQIEEIKEALRDWAKNWKWNDRDNDERFQEISETDESEAEASEDSNGDLIPFIWMIEKLRKREGGCTMNELVAEAKLNFKGIEQIKRR